MIPPLLDPGALTAASGDTVPTSVCNEVSAGTTFDRSDSAACQSKRLVAIWRTVWTRACASCWNCAYWFN